MPDSPQIPTGAAFAPRLAAFYAALFVVIGVQLPFLPVWLASKGLDAGAIGVVLALPMVVRVFAIPLAARAADRHDALRGAIAIAAVAATLGYLVLSLAQGAVAIAAALALASACYAPIMPLADAYAFRGLPGRAYGPVRLWGSAAFIAGSFAAGLLLEAMSARDLIWLLTAAMAVTAAAGCALAPLAPGGGKGAGSVGTGSVTVPLRDPRFLAVAAAASLIQASHAVYYGFSTLAWQGAGLGGGTIGALWALAVAAEIGLFAVSGRLALAPTRLLAAGAVGAVIRWGAMALDPPAVLLPALQCLHALSFGATHLGAVGFIARAASAATGATAQGSLAVALGLTMATAMGLAGMLYARWGALAYGAMAFLAAVGGMLAFTGGRTMEDGR